MRNKYLLSTGKITDRVEYYILDIIRINLVVLPNDIPGKSGIGFDYSMTNITTDQFKSTVQSKINQLLSKVTSQFPYSDIQLSRLDILDESRVNIEITVNGEISEEFNINVYNQTE